MRLPLGLPAFLPLDSRSGIFRFLLSHGFGYPRLRHFLHDFEEDRDTRCFPGLFPSHRSIMTPESTLNCSILYRQDFRTMTRRTPRKTFACHFRLHDLGLIRKIQMPAIG
jgi:hypothetical protein